MARSGVMNTNPKIAVVIPSYKVRNHILAVISQIGPEVGRIYVVDDCCPDGSGGVVESNCKDERVTIIRNSKNQGVGGAVMTGYKAAIDDGMDIIVKVDGDGQMDPSLIPFFIAPIREGRADYTKGNRFFRLEDVSSMPWIRIIGNAALSFLSKLSSGYWDIFDPTNGYVAVHRNVLKNIPLEKLSRDYFFESDMLFRLNTIRAVVMDIPMNARYAGEKSNLNVLQIVMPFLCKHIANFGKRIVYNYFLRDFNIASCELLLGTLLTTAGSGLGIHAWVLSVQTSQLATAGTVMLAALPVLIGLQLLLGFLNYDINNVPRQPIQGLVR